MSGRSALLLRSKTRAAALAGAVFLLGVEALAQPTPEAAVAPQTSTIGESRVEAERRAAAEARKVELERQLAEYAPELKDPSAAATLRDGSATSLAAMLVQMVAVLGAVALLAYILLGKALPRVLKVEQPLAPRRLLQIVDRLMIDQRRGIMVIKMSGQYFLVGSTEHGINLLAKLDPGEVEQALALARDEASAPGGLAGLFGRRSIKESRK